MHAWDRWQKPTHEIDLHQRARTARGLPLSASENTPSHAPHALRKKALGLPPHVLRSGSEGVVGASCITEQLDVEGDGGCWCRERRPCEARLLVHFPSPLSSPAKEVPPHVFESGSVGGFVAEQPDAEEDCGCWHHARRSRLGLQLCTFHRCRARPQRRWRCVCSRVGAWGSAGASVALATRVERGWARALSVPDEPAHVIRSESVGVFGPWSLMQRVTTGSAPASMRSTSLASGVPEAGYADIYKPPCLAWALFQRFMLCRMSRASHRPSVVHPPLCTRITSNHWDIWKLRPQSVVWAPSRARHGIFRGARTWGFLIRGTAQTIKVGHSKDFEARQRAYLKCEINWAIEWEMKLWTPCRMLLVVQRCSSTRASDSEGLPYPASNAPVRSDIGNSLIFWELGVSEVWKRSRYIRGFQN
ncbi:hypothetical protein K438DRAFT_2096261 [Mycena galopus ATCC 62051]|nr:hypothetical protein K438DRAFT_2096261 [Mycena galopus ATCC 62051]